MNLAYRRTVSPPSRRLPQIGSTRAGSLPGYRRGFALYPLLGSYSLPVRRALSVTDMVSTVVFALLPLFVIPVFLRLEELLYPRFPLLPRMLGTSLYLRPPTETAFFHEMLVLILSVFIVALVQVIGAAIFLKKAPWGEAVFVGGFFSLAVYGVLRGFQANPTDSLFFPLPALCGATIAWLGISGAILYPYFHRVFSR